MNQKNYPCPELVFQTAGLPEEGQTFEGEALLCSMDLQSDDRFQLEGAMLHYSLRFSVVKSDVIVQGRISTEIQALCDRCAEWSTLKLSAEDVFHRYQNRFGDPIDLTEDIREDILLTFPQTHLCQETCKGLCPMCGQNLNEAECGCDREGNTAALDQEFEKEKNPWAALEELNLDGKK